MTDLIQASKLPHDSAQRLALENKARIEAYTGKAKGIAACLALVALSYLTDTVNPLGGMIIGGLGVCGIAFGQSVGATVHKRMKEWHVEVK